MMRGTQSGLLKQNDGTQEGKRMRERISGAEHGLQAVPERSNKNSCPWSPHIYSSRVENRVVVSLEKCRFDDVMIY
jgi:hypothetical protein